MCLWSSTFSHEGGVVGRNRRKEDITDRSDSGAKIFGCAVACMRYGCNCRPQSKALEIPYVPMEMISPRRTASSQLTYVLSCLTKLEKLLCLKCLGNKSRANSGGFHTMKLQSGAARRFAATASTNEEHVPRGFSESVDGRRVDCPRGECKSHRHINPY